MNFKKVNINKTLIYFLLSHLVIWTLIPSISNNNLPLDTIEHLAWASDLQLGYGKHPPLVAWVLGFFFNIFSNQDWAYYFLSQLFVIFSFFIVFEFSKDFIKNPLNRLISILLLEGIYFYNFTTPEFNVNVCQMPFWSLTVYYCWKGIKHNNYTDWLLVGCFAALGVLSKYLFIYLLLAIDVFFVYLIVNKKFEPKVLLSLVTFFIILTPHLIWLTENNYTTITYAMNRAGFDNWNLFSSHILNPIIFIVKQIGILVPFFIMLFFIAPKLKIKIENKDKKFIFLFFINFLPIAFIFLTSLTLGVKIRTMWMTPFYLFIGVFFIYLLQKEIIYRKIKYFFIIFFILFITSPLLYFYISITQTDKRTDYPGKKISKVVQDKWDKNFVNQIGLVGGSEWHGGNLSYHLKSRPKWDNIFDNSQSNKIINSELGFVLIGDSDVLSKICNAIFFKVEMLGICMIGKRK